MVVIPRGLARSFRAAARKCQTARNRTPAPAVLVHAREKELHQSCFSDGVAIRLSVPQQSPETERFLVPMAVLDAVEGAAVEITISKRTGTARWEGRDGPQSSTFEIGNDDVEPEWPIPPEEMHTVAPAFLGALHECSRTAAREPSRYALNRVQVNGKAGSVAATNGKNAFICRGFTLPFREAVLVPAVPAFGAKEIARETEVQVGHTLTHLFVRAGPWTVCLTIDAEGRFPDVAGVIPKSSSSTVVGVDDRDAEEWLAVAPEWPDATDGASAVTLDVNKSVTARARNDDTREQREYRFSRSTWTGQAIRAVLDRRYLARALALGLRSLRIAAGKPVVAEGPDRMFLSVLLDDSLAVGPEPPSSILSNPSTSLWRLNSMKAEPNGRHPPPPSDSTAESIDPLAEIDALRVALVEAANRVGRLTQFLNHFSRHRRTLEDAFTSLKTLGVGTGGES
jgi:hypothetical protein